MSTPLILEKFTKENPAANGANLKAFDSPKDNPKLKKAQRKNCFAIEITLQQDHSEDAPAILVLNGRHAKSLWYLNQCRTGLTRIEALDEHRILSLTQHVHFFRNQLNLEIITERILPTRYANYRLITPISIRILSQGRK
jgi:hypothetical protein